MKKLMLFANFLLFATIYSQEQVYIPNTPEASLITRYGDYPVDMSTGLPSIEIPLFNLPTRSKDISMNLGLSYHQSSITHYDSLTTDFGRGWSINDMGVISGENGLRELGGASSRLKANYDSIQNGGSSTYIQHSKQEYSFNFLGNSGKFYIFPKSDGLLAAEIVENNNKILEIVPIYSTQDFVVTGFYFYDNKGYRYDFLVSDTFIYLRKILNQLYNSNPSEPYPEDENYQPILTIIRETQPSNFKLSKIVDNNGMTLLEVEYSAYEKVEDYHEGNEKNITYKANKIISEGYGEVIIDRTIVNQDETKVNQVYLKDTNSNLIEKYQFILNQDKQLVELKQGTSTTKSHFFEYKNSPTPNDFIRDYDFYGYPNATSKYVKASGTVDDFRSSLSRMITPNATSNGVLNKITYPTGMITTFEYENNTYSFYKCSIPYKIAIDNDIKIELIAIRDSVTQEIIGYEEAPEYFTQFFPSNIHNFNEEIVASHTFESSGLNQTVFNLTVPSKVFFYFHGEPFTYNAEIEEGGVVTDSTMITSYPIFTILKDDQIIDSFSHNNFSGPFSDTLSNPINNTDPYYRNSMNGGLGKDLLLQPGVYTVVISNTVHPAAGNFIARKLTPKLPYNYNASLFLPQESSSHIQKFEYGPGIRIKKIKQFVDEQQLNQNSNPERTLEYFYHLFDEIDRSSGFSFRDPYTHVSRDTLGIIRYINTSAPGGGYYSFRYKNNWYERENIIYYANVTVFERGNDNSILYKKQHEFLNNYENPIQQNLSYSVEKKAFLRKPKHVKYFNSEADLISDTEYSYEFGLHPTNMSWLEPTLITNKEYFPSGSFITNSETFKFSLLNRLLTEKTSTTSDGITNKVKYFYKPIDSQLPIEVTRNNISLIERVENFKNNELLGSSVTVYDNNWVGQGLSLLNNAFLLKEIKNAKGSNDLELKVKINFYDEYSHPLEVQQENGTPIAYIWGYNLTQPIAKIENATYAQVQPYLANLQSLSNGTNESALLSALNDLRTALPNAMVTTYTYKPLIGISTVTDPKGDTQTYHYDSFNRLQYVKDKDGNILSENQYHYRTQN